MVIEHLLREYANAARDDNFGRSMLQWKLDQYRNQWFPNHTVIQYVIPEPQPMSDIGDETDTDTEDEGLADDEMTDIENEPTYANARVDTGLHEINPAEETDSDMDVEL